jgi:ribulose-phosphate 3-epimerase
MLSLLDRFEYEIDLMCLDAEEAAETWLSLGATRLTFHAEATTDLPRLLSHMHERHSAGPQFAERLVSFGAAIGLETDLAILESSLTQLDYVQFMGIASIGKQGQPFDTRVYERVRRFHAKHPEVPIQIDGGENFDHAQKLAALGASSIIVGSALLKSSDPVAAAAMYENIGGSYGV